MAVQPVAGRAPGDDASDVLDAVVIGSGFGGLGAGAALLRAGIDRFVILEAADAVGGTWRDNTYPGCACDIPSHLYSFSFAQNPEWTRSYPAQPEIEAYLERTTDALGLRPFIRFGREVAELRWDDGRALWRVLLAGGSEVLGPVGDQRHRVGSAARPCRTSPASTASPARCSTPPAGATTTTSPASGSA